MQLGHGFGVVEHLGQQPRHVDGVRGREAVAGAQLRIVETGLHQSLAIVERALHGEGGDVVPEGGELDLLQVRDSGLRIEHHHPRAGALPEGLGHRRAGIATGGGENRQGPSRFADQVQDVGEKPRAHILERQGWAMEQFQDMEASAHLGQGDGEIQGAVDGRGESVLVEFVADEAAQDDLAALHPAQLQETVPVLEDRQRFRHPESAPRGHALQHRLTKSGRVSGVSRTDKFQASTLAPRGSTPQSRASEASPTALKAA